MPITVVKGAVWDSANALEDTTPEAFRTDISVDRPVQSDLRTTYSLRPRLPTISM
jgi:hypothetical protein